MRFRAAVPVVLAVLASCSAPAGNDAAPAPQGWTPASPREEIRPAFRFDPHGGRDGKGGFIVQHDRREGLQGCWVRTYGVEGGKYYRFAATRRVTDVALARRSAVARILWQDEKGKQVLLDEKWDREVLKNFALTAEAEHPTDQGPDAAGWAEVTGVYLAPSRARRAVVELHLDWAPGGRVEWSEVSFAECAAPEARKVRLAAVHHRPAGKTAEENRQSYVPLLEEAAGLGASRIDVERRTVHRSAP